MKEQSNIRRATLVATSILSLSLLPSAGHAAPAAPGAGNILQQMQQKPPQAPSHTNTGLRAPKTPKQQLPKGVTFHVTKIEITGNTLFTTATLHALVASGEGQTQSLQQLDGLAGRITAYYHRHGYSLSRAIIPAQQIKSGVVKIQVIEAHFDKINLNNQSRVRVGLLQSTLSGLHSGNIIADSTVNRALLLLSDIPGVASSATLSPGSSVGTSDLNVTAKSAPLVTGQISADNFGNQYTGRGRFNAGVNINDPLHLGDVLSLNFMSAGHDMNYGSAAYDVVLNGYGTSVGASYSAMRYILGSTLSQLHSYGTAHVTSAWLRQPLIRSLVFNLYAQAQFDNKRLVDHIDLTGIRTDRHLNDGAFSISGDVRDRVFFGRAAVSTFSATWTGGDLSFDDPAAAAADAATAKTAGHFERWQGSMTRLQGLDAHDAFYASISGQWTNGNLDSVEKLVVGGPYSVRGYDMGILSADTGYVGQFELRHQFNSALQVKLFADGTHVHINRKVWVKGRNVYTLGDAGIGLDVNAPYQWHLTGYLAKPIGKIPAALSNNTTWRGWVQLSKAF